MRESYGKSVPRRFYHRWFPLSQSAEQKLARCPLGLLSYNVGCDEEVSLQPDPSHESIAQLIGVSRQTVTPDFVSFAKQAHLGLQPFGTFRSGQKQVGKNRRGLHSHGSPKFGQRGPPENRPTMPLAFPKVTR